MPPTAPTIMPVMGCQELQLLVGGSKPAIAPEMVRTSVPTTAPRMLPHFDSLGRARDGMGGTAEGKRGTGTASWQPGQAVCLVSRLSAAVTTRPQKGHGN